MPICPACGKVSPDDFRFCGSCGAQLGASAASGTAEERKVVSVLFCDLVGFTNRSDAADPEDVRARLRPYHERAKRELERFGGTVEKFVGDAVMAVFGAPVTHEDDAERAVRAGLAVLTAIEELNAADPDLALAVRVAVNTGEAVVSVGARPELGEGFVAGDVVNTAARLQQSAQPGTIVVGESTYRLTRGAVEYEAPTDVELKGKREPVRSRRARSALRYGEAETQRTPYIGRADELALLERTFARAVGESAAQLVTVVGEPGAGKSRLVEEFRRLADAEGVTAAWRRGRCLPYGEGITFWALGEVVKAECGILESDSHEEATTKLRAAVAAVSEGERDWVQGRLAPLVGVATATSAAVNRRESFTAWRTFLEALALRGPLVVVLEDLHWAGEALLEFIEHFVDHAADVPLLVLCTARPELYESRPGWGGGKRNTTTISLPPLTEAQTARLVSAILARSILPAEIQAGVLERAGGNPLFAEEFARMVGDRQTAAGGSLAVDVTVPETVQALIAARLDTLPAERKSLLQDAAVLGKVFWSEGVAAMGGRDANEVEDGLHQLAQKELIRRARTSSVEGQSEYGFWHVLVRDVAYAQIPRAERSRKHRVAAEWIERIAGDRVADHAELLAHHYREALALAGAVGEDVAALEEPARRFLIEAARRAEPLDQASAESLYLEALALLPTGDSRRTNVLTRLGWLANNVGRVEAAEDRLLAAIAEAEAADRPAEAAAAIAGLSFAYSFRGETKRAHDLLEQSIARLDTGSPVPALGPLYSELARRNMLSAHYRDCHRWADRAIAVYTETDNAAATVRPLQFRAAGRIADGDFEGGVADYRESIRLGLELGLGSETGIGYQNLANAVWWLEGAQHALPLVDRAVDLSGRRGLEQPARYAAGERLWLLFDLGAWDELVREADELSAWEESATGATIGQIRGMALPFKASVLGRRGDTERAQALVDGYLPRLREIGDPQLLVPALTIAAVVALAAGETATAVSLVDEIERGTRGSNEFRHLYLADLTRVCVAAGELGLARRLRQSSGLTTPRNRHFELTADAILAEAAGGLSDAATLYSDAAERWDEFGNVPERAHALLGCGRVLLALDRPDGAGFVRNAQEIFASLGYHAPLVEAESLLGGAAAPTS